MFREGISRRAFLKGTVAGIAFSFFNPFSIARGEAVPSNPLFWVKNIPEQPFDLDHLNHHIGIDSLIQIMGDQGLKFYRSAQETDLSGSSGMIASDDVVLIKVNGQWKYRGCTNSDLIQGLIQAILEHPDGYTGEVVIFENGQSQGSLNGNGKGWGDIRMTASMPMPILKVIAFNMSLIPFLTIPGFPHVCSIRLAEILSRMMIIPIMATGNMKMSLTPVSLQMEGIE